MKNGASETAKPAMVKIKLHKGRSRQEAEDVFVSVNGERYQIQRGVEVEVPYYIAEVLGNSERQDNAAMAYKEKLAAKFAKA